MNRILLEDAHAQAGSGAPGEREWSKALNDRIVPLLAARGIETVRVGGTTLDQPVYHQDYLCFVTNHYDADIYTAPDGSHVGGAFWGRADASASGPADDRLGQAVWLKFRATPGAPADMFGRRNANTRQYYAFNYTSAQTPGVIFEWGVGSPVCNGHGQPTAPDHDWLRANIDQVALAVATGIFAFHFAQGGEDDMDRTTFNAWFREQQVAEISPTIVAMKAAYDPLIAAAAVSLVADAELKARIDKLKTI